MASQKSKIQNPKSNNSSVLSMAQLLASYKSPFVSLQKGQVIKGKITKLTSAEILVDINSKSEAVVLEKDKSILRNILSNLKVGEEVSVSVLNPESDLGNPVVSLRRFIHDLFWKRFEDQQKNKEEIEVLVTELTKGGFIVILNGGFTGFLPNSQVSHLQNQNDILNKKIKVFILELNRELRKIILSQKPIIESKDFEEAIKNLKIGQKIDATITSVTSFGAFASLVNESGKNPIDGLLHISEIAWEKTTDMNSLFAQGQKVQAVIIGFDKEAKRVDLSIKKLTADPFEEVLKKYTVEQKVIGRVSKILSNGIALEIEDPSGKMIDGFIRKEKIPPNVTYEAGDKLNAIIAQIDKEKHKILLVPVLKEKPIGYR